jgi:TolB-like protein
MADICISYARADFERVRTLALALKAQGWSVWWDDDVRGGEVYAKDIQKALEEARVVVAVWSKSSIESNWVRDEAEFGRDRGTLVPISLDGAVPPLGFRQFQCTDLSQWNGEVPAPEKLLAAVAARLGTETPLPTAKPPLQRRSVLAIAAASALAAAVIGVAIAWIALAPGGGAKAPAQVKDAAASATVPATQVAAPEKSVAVLPFSALSSGVDDGYFADGLTEEIINALTTLPDLLVTARTSAFHFKRKNAPIPEIAATLGVAHVVEGSVRRSGDKVRITAQLIRAADGFHLWSEAFDRSLGDDLTVQGEIAESVAKALGVLLDEERRAVMTGVGVKSVDAFLAYQRGVDLFNRAHNDGPLIVLLAKANAEFEAAVAQAPDLAQAYFLHADYYAHFLIDEAPGHGPAYRSELGLGVAEAERRLIEDLDAALRREKDPRQRRVIEAVRNTVLPDWRGLQDRIERAYAEWNHCRTGLWLDQTGMLFGIGEAVHRRNVELARCDPLSTSGYGAVQSATWLGRPSEGLELAKRIEAAQGRTPDLIHATILAELALGRIAKAEQLLAEGHFDGPDTPEFQRIVTYQVAAAAGRAEEWQKLKSGLEREPEKMLLAAAVFGDREAANRAAAELDSMTFGPMILIRIADRCGCGAPYDLEATPNFARLLREADLPWSPLAPIPFPLKTW